MAITPQEYPRDEKGFLDVARVAPHKHKISINDLYAVIAKAITDAAGKSSRAILEGHDHLSDEDKIEFSRRKGKDLFTYFRKYYGDPAATAYACVGKHYAAIANEQFRNQTLQMERMNSGWRYQFIAKDCALRSRRFISVSDIGAAEADFNATMQIVDTGKTLNIYVSIKNRANTMGGQDWPKAIYALEDVARGDKNRSGPYLCVFGIVIEKGQRLIKAKGKSKSPHSFNTEVWLSDFFWPFFSNFSYSQIAKAVLHVLMQEAADGKPAPLILIPDVMMDVFGEECSKCGLLDSAGNFSDPEKLIDVFCDTKGV